MLSSQEVLNLVSKAGPGVGGLLAAIDRRIKSPTGGGGRVMLPNSQRAFLDDLSAIPRPAPLSTYNHPGDGITGNGMRGPLSNSEVAWVSGLPSDRDEMSFDDARQLAQLIADLNAPDPLKVRDGQQAERDPGDLRLLHSKYDPVAEQHDIRQAQVAHDNAVRSIPPVPSSALAALATSIQGENDQLRPDEALNRASEQLQGVLAQRDAQHQAQVANAASRLEAALAAPVNRKATTR